MTCEIIVFLVFTAITSSPTELSKGIHTIASSEASWLYVGGTGPGNYTKIQDAIDNASEGDIIFVYDDSSPYYENIVIQKSITLIGEDKTSTEINGSFLDDSLDTVNITGDHVTIRDFCISHNRGYYYQAAIKVTGQTITISQCIIRNNEWVGIYLVGASECQLLDCELNDNLVAVNLVHASSNIIQNCSCHDNSDAITLFQSSNNNQIINCSCIRNHFDGIHVQQSSGNLITGCVCKDGNQGISLAYAPQTTLQSNIMKNNYMNFGIGSTVVSDYYCTIDTSNTINEKPMYYLIEQQNLLVNDTMQIGFLGLVSCENITVKNLVFTNNFEGMLVAGTSHSSIENCSFRTNDGHGIMVVSSKDILVKNCTFQNSFFDGIFLFNSSGITINNCSCDGSTAGIRLEFSTHNIMKALTVSQCTIGVLFDSSHSNVLKNNKLFNCGVTVTGSSLPDYINEVDSTTTVNGKPVYYLINETNLTIPSNAGEVILIHCTGCTVSHLNLSRASIGIELAYSFKNTIVHNILTNQSIVAIDLDGADNNDNIITENTIQGNNYGIDVDSSSNNSIQGNMLFQNGLGFSFSSSQGNMIDSNTIQDGYYGMYFEYSAHNTVMNNIIDNTSVFGMYLLSSPHNIVRTNQMVNCSLMVYGNTLDDYINDVDASTTVNGKPLYYYLHQTGRLIPRNAGQVFLINCSRCIVKNLNVNKGTIGITLAYSSQNMITRNNIQGQSMIAIDLGHAQNNDNTIQGNILKQNSYGVDVEFSEGTIIKRNVIVSNGYGIVLYTTFNNTIQRNTISKNNVGIYAREAPGNTIRSNNIYKNSMYGLTVEACLVTARWNWWGAASGPTFNGDGNGDCIDVIKNGLVTYAPWRVLPVLFTGRILTSLTIYPQKNFQENMDTISGKRWMNQCQTTTDFAMMCDIKNTRNIKEYIVPSSSAVKPTFENQFLCINPE